MALEPITRQEKIIAGQDLEPITRMEMFLKNFGGGGGSVPKPLTYDYMPEGYPTKSVQTTTLMEEQELAFTSTMGAYAATLTNVLEIVVGQTYTVKWDGTAYERVCSAFNSAPYLGNLSIVGMGDDTGEPFLYIYNISQSICQFVTTDTSASHTISVKTTAETVTPMTYDYMPDGYPKKSVQTTTLMEERELAFTAGLNGAYGATPPHKFVPVEGKTYTVNWDGTEYECVCVVVQTKLTLGNLSIMGWGDDTGEPFLCRPAEPIFITLDTSASHTISVKTTVETVTPMAEEFLPSEINELIMNSSTPDSTKKFKITVNDSGAITATEVT